MWAHGDKYQQKMERRKKYQVALKEENIILW
jgi:hypothetical protein